jgi:hypothetical protein
VATNAEEPASKPPRVPHQASQRELGGGYAPADRGTLDAVTDD